jgi:hypothetical protein
MVKGLKSLIIFNIGCNKSGLHTLFFCIYTQKTPFYKGFFR